jgi:RNA polymerase sigma-70 factor, ECF subfamily
MSADAVLVATYERHAGVLVRLLTSRTRDYAAAEDLAHEAFVRLACQLRGGNVPDDPVAWVTRVAFNLEISRGRRTTVARRHAAAHRQDPGVAESPERAVVESESIGILGAALARLSSSERMAVVLAARGETSGSIGYSLGRSAAAARTLVCRSRSKLRREFALAGGAR